MALVVVLAGGGTGGHIFPALALAEAIRKREPEAHVRFVGTARGLETRYVPTAGYALDLVPSAAVTGRGVHLPGLAGQGERRDHDAESGEDRPQVKQADDDQDAGHHHAEPERL